MFLLDTTRKQLIYQILMLRKEKHLEQKEAYEYHYYTIKGLKNEIIEIVLSDTPKLSEDKIIYSVY